MFTRPNLKINLVQLWCCRIENYFPPPHFKFHIRFW
uniref:Uncharacterized protein n=1 Tax=Arundo donax TaxID=35708 RepID=A0A0A8YHF7_ARUDO